MMHRADRQEGRNGRVGGVHTLITHHKHSSTGAHGSFGGSAQGVERCQQALADGRKGLDGSNGDQRIAIGAQGGQLGVRQHGRLDLD